MVKNVIPGTRTDYYNQIMYRLWLTKKHIICAEPKNSWKEGISFQSSCCTEIKYDS